MRRTIASSVKATARVARHESSIRISFICGNCRRATQQTRNNQARTSRRAFATTTISRQQIFAASEQQPRKEYIAPQTHYDFFPNTFPSGPPPNSPFTPDLRDLRREFLQLQAKTHPDLAAQDKKRQAEALSMRVNEAYKTLQDPLSRARYLLSLHGIDVEDDSAKLEENALLMEVMEAREAVEEVENEEQLVEIRKENNVKIDASVSVLSEAFSHGDTDTAAQEAVRLRYWMNIEESIQGWEKGKGGGVIHH